MVEEGNVEAGNNAMEEKKEPSCFWGPIGWLRMLASETHWSFIFGVVSVYGISQGLGGALARVGTDYYMKDVQKVQPSELQVYNGIISIPWIVKPIWGILTDVVSIWGYRRRPYFILSGLLALVSMLLISLHSKLHLVFALLALTAGSAAVAISDVTIDACVAQNSISHPSLATDMQSLCTLMSASGALVGFFISGVLVHLLGPKGVFGLLTIPAALVFLVGIILSESHDPNFAYKEINQKFIDAGKAMWTTLKCPEVWRPCLYMYLSFAMSLNVNEGLFYWYTDSKGGPSFSQETIGYILSMGAVGAILGAILYQNKLKDEPFRDLLFWIQLFYGLSGMLDLMLVLRINLRFGVPDYLFVVIGEAATQMMWRLKWMPLLVLTTKLCPSGIEGTFFALLMSIDNAGLLSSSWGGGLLLHLLNVTRTKFDNLWLAILIRNILRLSPLGILFLVPRGDHSSSILPTRMLSSEDEEDEESKNVELVSLVNSGDGR